MTVGDVLHKESNVARCTFYRNGKYFTSYCVKKSVPILLDLFYNKEVESYRVIPDYLCAGRNYDKETKRILCKDLLITIKT